MVLLALMFGPFYSDPHKENQMQPVFPQTSNNLYKYMIHK